MDSNKFIKKFLALTLAICVLLGAFMYFLDPWLYYRINDKDKYWLDGTFVSAGLIKNVDYDTAVIGSSYFQNFDMDWFREKLNANPVNLSIPGLDLLETETVVNDVLNKDKADILIICLTDYTFETDQDKNRMPKYLFDENKLNDIQYLYSYEAWVKFMPLDVATKAIDKVMPSFTEKYKTFMDRDELGNKNQNYQYGKEILKEQFKTLKRDREIVEDEDAAYNIMKDNFLSYIENIKIKENSNKQYIFVLPPFSAFYWYEMQRENRLDYYLKFEKLVVEEFSKYPNVRLVNTQTLPEVEDLNNYRDITHFNLEIQEKIVDLMKDKKNDLTVDNIEQKQTKIRNMVEEFKKDNADWVK
ncbi:hypothetical protein [Intestinibacter sp.]